MAQPKKIDQKIETVIREVVDDIFERKWLYSDKDSLNTHQIERFFSRWVESLMARALGLEFTFNEVRFLYQPRNGNDAEEAYQELHKAVVERAFKVMVPKIKEIISSYEPPKAMLTGLKKAVTEKVDREIDNLIRSEVSGYTSTHIRSKVMELVNKQIEERVEQVFAETVAPRVTTELLDTIPAEKPRGWQG